MSQIFSLRLIHAMHALTSKIQNLILVYNWRSFAIAARVSAKTQLIRVVSGFCSSCSSCSSCNIV